MTICRQMIVMIYPFMLLYSEVSASFEEDSEYGTSISSFVRVSCDLISSVIVALEWPRSQGHGHIKIHSCRH